MNTLYLQLSNGCKFHLGDVPDAWQAWYSDSDWQDVSLPHDWSVTLPFSRAYSSGTGYLAGGIGWYRIHIQPNPEWMGKRIRINFDGIYKNSRVWCNSYYLGERPNGYISFSYDITDQFRFDRENVIAVYVNHSDIADSRWFTGSGITRKAVLVIEETVHPAYQGLSFITEKSDEETASLKITHEVMNENEWPVQLSVIDELYDDRKQLIATFTNTATVTPHQLSEIKNKGVLVKPELWSPSHPHLYTLKTYYRINHTTPYLVSTNKVGIRSFRFDPNHGFFLNGQSYLLKGVCVHHDGGCLGAALTPAVWYRRLQKLKEMGCNAIRMSHNPHMPELYDLCDSLGFFVIDEAFDEWEGPKNKWSTGHNVYPPKHQGYYTDFPTWHEKDLVDMIKRDRNHPSVILWSIGNEIDYPNDPYCHASFETMTGNNDANKPASERLYNPDRPNAARLSVLCRHLSDIVKKTDPSRPVTLACAFPELSVQLGFIDPLDVVGYNYKEHLYEESHRLFPGKPFLGSENGHGLSQWESVTQNPYISGQFLWTGIDYLGEAHGWPIHGSGAGLMTLAGFEKPGYYRRQSFWSDKPMVHLTTIRETESNISAWGQVFENAISCEHAPVEESWNYLSGESILIKCYTNQPEVELFVNHVSKGIYEKDVHADCIIAVLPFEEGELEAVSYDSGKNIIAQHTLYTTLTPCQLSVKKYPVDITQLPVVSTCCSPCTFTDLVQYEITLLDSNGHRVYSAENLLTVSVENGILLGLENGNLSDYTDYTSSSRRAYRGELLIYALPYDDMKLTIKGQGLQAKIIH